jgi:hypothetical protein
MPRIKSTYAYLALGEGFNDDRMRFDSIILKIKSQTQLTDEEKTFYKNICEKGMAIHEKRTDAAFDRMFEPK